MAFVQAVKSTFSAGGGGTVAVTISGVAAGAVLAVFVQCGDQNATCTCADNVNSGNYTAVDVISDNTNNNRGFSFYMKNSLAGSPVVTATFGASAPFTQIVVGEFSGRDTASPLDGHNGAFQAAAGTGTDAVSTGNLSTTQVDDIFGATWVEDGTTPTITHGTGFTERLTEAVPMEVESADAVASGNNPVTWTISAGAGMLSMGMAFKAAAKPVGANFGNIAHPGQSPGLGGIGSARFQTNWWPYSPPVSITFDPAFMIAMEKHGNDPLVLPPQVVASGMTPPEEMPT